MEKVSIILNDWNGYPLTRYKKFNETLIECGLKQLLGAMEKFDAGIKFEVILIVNCSDEKWFHKYLKFKKYKKTAQSTYKALQDQYPFISDVIFRDNKGMDIGAYNLVLSLLTKATFSDDLIFMNTSVLGPSKDNWLIDIQSLFIVKKTSLVEFVKK